MGLGSLWKLLNCVILLGTNVIRTFKRTDLQISMILSSEIDQLNEHDLARVSFRFLKKWTHQNPRLTFSVVILHMDPGRKRFPRSTAVRQACMELSSRSQIPLLPSAPILNSIGGVSS